MTGPQWIALDARYFFSPLADRLQQRFGAAGLVLWPAFLCAAKNGRPPGTLTFGSDTEALNLMGLTGLELADGNGAKFELGEFWRLTGQLKQTKRTRRGQLLNVTSTHWERWQDDARIEVERERKRRWWAENRGKGAASDPSALAAKLAPDSDSDSDLKRTSLSPFKTAGAPPPHPAEKSSRRVNGTNPRSTATNPRAAGTNPRSDGTNPRTLAAEQAREQIPDWQPEPDPTGLVDSVAAAALRAALEDREPR